jgi:regulator of replication initiation timing
MELVERAQEARRSFARDRLEHRLNDAVNDNDRLRSENDLLREQIDHGRRIPKSGSRTRRLVVFGIGVGTAYVMGTKAGRERYEQIRSWWGQLRGRVMDVQDDLQYAVAETAETTTGRIAERVEESSASASDALKTGGERTAERVREAGRQTADAATRK